VTTGEHHEAQPWQPRIAIDALPFVRVSAHGAIPRGQLAVVDTTQLDHAIDIAATALHPEEIAMAEALPVTRRTLFISGRVALRAAIDRVDREASSVALLRNARGAPTIPSGLIGSISHKRAMAVAVVAPTSDKPGTRATLGIDIEERAHMRPTMRDIAPRILTSNELRMLPGDARRMETVLLFFALKEAIYKAIDPYVERHVRFQEVEIGANDSFTNDTGSAPVALNLPEFKSWSPLVTVHWWKDEDHLFAVASSSSSSDAQAAGE
jgi:enterobactin synthetase component D